CAVSPSSGKFSLYLSRNFSSSSTVSPLIPTTRAPSFSSSFLASRNWFASLVQPGVSALGKKYSTSVLSSKSFKLTLAPESDGKLKPGALSPALNMVSALPEVFSETGRGTPRLQFGCQKKNPR